MHLVDLTLGRSAGTGPTAPATPSEIFASVTSELLNPSQNSGLSIADILDEV